MGRLFLSRPKNFLERPNQSFFKLDKSLQLFSSFQLGFPADPDGERAASLLRKRKKNTIDTASPTLPLPENDDVTFPMTPTELKDRIIFGPSSPHDSLPIVEALTLSVTSPRPSSASSFQDQTTPRDPQSQSKQAWPIDPNYPWTKTKFHRSKTAPAMATINEINQATAPRPQFAKQKIVRQGCILLTLYLSLGVIVYYLNRDHFSTIETHPIVDALYFCIVTRCTIGYGDITPTSTATKLFSVLFVLVGFGFIDILLSGMVSYVLDLQESYLLKTVKGEGEKESATSFLVDVKKGRMRIRMKVGLALGVVVLCVGVGMAVMHFVETLGWLDSFYLSVMSVTTVGYGDQAFKSMSGRIFASIWLLVSTLAVARAFLYLAEARVDKRHRKMAKWILSNDMTVSEFLAADIDNNGFVSKSEYVIYKLKEMGKVPETDIMQICKKFDRLDSGNCGKITLSDLMDNHQQY